MTNRPWSWLAAGIALLAALYFVGFVWAGATAGVPAYDIYSYTYPIVLYAVQRVAAGGSGLLWNPLQNCGQPFFGISSTGLLYPANVFYLVLSPDHALYAVTVFNLTVAGVSTYMLARELGVGRLAAVAGALAFELGNTSVDVNTFGPLVGGGFAWVPAIMWGCERLLRAPTLRGSVLLSVLIAIALLPGFPQGVVFAYQMIALRVLWALLFRQLARPLASLSSLALGLGLAPLLVAVQYAPGIEMARLSVRNAPLTLPEILASSGGVIDWKALQDSVSRRTEILEPLLLLPCMVASWSLISPTTRRSALFYVVAGLVFFDLALGPNGVLFNWYLRLPFGRTFRGPGRFLWMTGFSLAVMTALGIAALRGADTRSWRRGVAFGVAAALALVGFRALSRIGLWPLEWVLGGITIAAGVVGASLPSAARWASAFATAALVLNLASFPLPALPGPIADMAMRRPPFRRPLASDELLFAHRELFAQLRARMTGQDRIYLVYPHAIFRVMAKSAQLFGVPAIQDYEPQPTRRSAEYAVMMRTRGQMHQLGDYYLLAEGQGMITGLQRGLLDLAAARYLVVESSADATRLMRPPLEPVLTSDDGTVRVYENQAALPRARYVPRVEVVDDPQAVLRRLDRQRADAHERAFVEHAPASGFIGETDGNGGAVEFLADEPERVVLRVDAPQRGFLLLADQYYPGWRATVDGTPSEILVANYLFRIVEVPAGQSVVEFRYVPTSVRIGAAVSVLALAAAAVVWWAGGVQGGGRREVNT